MADQNHDVPATDLPVILGQRELQVAPKHSSEAASKGDELKKGAGGCRWIPLAGWFQMLYANFGSFVPLAMLAYGLQQSCAKSTQEFAYKYYMMDELKLDGATIGRLHTTSMMPWNIKPVLGMLSDAVPLCGFHRTSYLVIMCVLCILMYLWLGFFALSTLGLLLCMTGINLGVAMSDLVLDATAAGLAKQHPAQACDLQTSLQVSRAVGGMTSSLLKGALLASLGPRRTILSNIACSVAVLVPALRRWLPEERAPVACCTLKAEKLTWNSNLAAAAIFLAIVAVALSVTQTVVQDWRLRASVVCFCGILVVLISYGGLRKISARLSNTALLLFLRAFLQPGLGESMFVWMSKAENGPQFTPQLLGMADCFGMVGLLLGVLCFNTLLRRWTYRSIFLLAQSLVILCQLLDLILVMRWNTVIGVPDLVFYLGDETFDQAVARILSLPLVVLAYKVCPSNLEATMFSTLIATNNIGIDCGKYLGVTLAEFWGLVDGNFDYLPHGIVSKAVIRLFSIPLILILAPSVTPDDPISS